MRGQIFIFLPIFIIAALLTGCVNKPRSNNTIVESTFDYDKGLKQCITESDYLAKKNKAEYGRLNDALIQMLSGIKSYSSQLSHIDEKNKEIITSMYMYQVNDLCNTISQSYLFEVKKDLNKIVDRTKGN